MTRTNYPVINPVTSVVENVMMMMFLIERSEFDDDDVVMMMMFLFEISECDDDDVPDQNIRI